MIRPLFIYRLAIIIGCITLAGGPTLIERMTAGKTEVRKLDACEEYIQTYHQAAIQQQQKHRIPASITLAQGILESGAGKSYLAVEGNNHFGIKCGNWKGDYLYKHDDGRLERFRKYASAEQSFEDHSLFIAERSHYKALFDLKPTDYVGWANGLRKYGYATDPKYAGKLIELIERYQLHTYDLARGSGEAIASSRTNNAATTPSAPAKRPATTTPKPADKKLIASTQREPGSKPTAHGIKIPKKSKPEAAASKAQKEPATQPAKEQPTPAKAAPKKEAAPAPKADEAKKPAADPKPTAAKKPAPAEAKKPAPAPKADSAKKPAADPKPAAAKKPAPADAKKPAPAPKADAAKKLAAKPAPAASKVTAAAKKPATAAKKSAIASAKKPVATKKATTQSAAKKPAAAPKKQPGKLVASAKKSNATGAHTPAPKKSAWQAKKLAAKATTDKPTAKPATKTASPKKLAAPAAKPAEKPAATKKAAPKAFQKTAPQTPKKTSTLRRHNNNERPTVHTARRQRLERRRA